MGQYMDGSVVSKCIHSRSSFRLRIRRLYNISGAHIFHHKDTTFVIRLYKGSICIVDAI